MQKAMLTLLLCACAATAQKKALFEEPRIPGKSLWRLSLVTLAAANAMDVHSSWGRHELNPTLAAGPKATFGVQGALFKVGLQGGLVGIEYLLTRRHPSGKVYRVLSIVNFGAASGVGAVAAHNYALRSDGR